MKKAKTLRSIFKPEKSLLQVVVLSALADDFLSNQFLSGHDHVPPDVHLERENKEIRKQQ